MELTRAFEDIFGGPSNHLDLVGKTARDSRLSWDRTDVLSQPNMTWTPHLAALLAGVDDDNSVLSMIKGQESSLLRHIYSYSIAFVYDNWRETSTPLYKQYVHNTLPANLKGKSQLVSESFAKHLVENCDENLRTSVPVCGEVVAFALRSSRTAFTRCGKVSFPPPSGVDVNMMPFIFGDKSSLPEYLQPYYDPLIGSCPLNFNDIGQVFYLTVKERRIDQRRGELHIEAPLHYSSCSPLQHCSLTTGESFERQELTGPDTFRGGIFMASSASNSCAIYDALIDKRTTDSHGGMEHLRPLLNRPYFIPANELIWMTDHTPHQALPQRTSDYRQFFRLVTSGVNVWHAHLNTVNPKVPLPPQVLVVNESRFEDSGISGNGAPI